MVRYTTATTQEELQQILDLQESNLSITVTQEEAQEQGFVTVHHNMEILSAMNQKYQHVIAKDGDQVVGYALVMLQEFSDEISVLSPMFTKINTLFFKNQALTDLSYFVMGQVCVAKGYRGQGVFNGLYQQMKKEMGSLFDCIVTEIATRNTRSMRAHEKIGFEVVDIFSTEKEEWAIVAWDWT